VTGEPQLALMPLSGISSDDARDARARAWAFVFQCWRDKQMTAELAPKPDGPDDYEGLARRKGGQRDLIADAALDAEGDRPEQTRKDKRGFVHR
jgi:hypothetical protein